MESALDRTSGGCNDASGLVTGLGDRSKSVSIRSIDGRVVNGIGKRRRVRSGVDVVDR